MRNHIYINKHPAGRISNMHFGVCAILDGLVRVLSFGFLHSTFCLDQSRNAAKKAIEKAKKLREKELTNT